MHFAKTNSNICECFVSFCEANTHLLVCAAMSQSILHSKCHNQSSMFHCAHLAGSVYSKQTHLN